MDRIEGTDDAGFALDSPLPSPRPSQTPAAPLPSPGDPTVTDSQDGILKSTLAEPAMPDPKNRTETTSSSSRRSRTSKSNQSLASSLSFVTKTTTRDKPTKTGEGTGNESESRDEERGNQYGKSDTWEDEHDEGRPTSTARAPEHKSDKKSVSLPVIISVSCVGGLVLLGGLASLAFFCIRRKQSQAEATDRPRSQDSFLVGKPQSLLEATEDRMRAQSSVLSPVYQGPLGTPTSVGPSLVSPSLRQRDTFQTFYEPELHWQGARGEAERSFASDITNDVTYGMLSVVLTLSQQATGCKVHARDLLLYDSRGMSGRNVTGSDPASREATRLLFGTGLLSNEPSGSLPSAFCGSTVPELRRPRLRLSHG